MTDPEPSATEGSTADEVAREQRHLDAAYARLDAMRRAAERVAEGYSVQERGTFQARLEREAAEANTRRRLAALDIGDAPLSFGRLDLVAGATERDADPAARGPFYIGRISVTDEDLRPLVVDWRAPVAEPFYRATPLEPMGVARRRHFQTHGRRLIGIDDEVFDRAAADTEGLSVVGEGALLAALERERTGRMRDIVATIQAEQDEAIRAPLPGISIVAGGPGTGKTAVALHRAAYLLYTHRKRLGAQGVLLVGPSPIFLRYIDEVLPSLGENEVVLATTSTLKPAVSARAAESAATAALKGDLRMVRVVQGAVADRERPMPRDVVVTLGSYRLRLRRRDSRRIVERTRARRGTHNERRPYIAALVIDHFRREYRRALVSAYRGATTDVDDVTVAALLARGEPAPEEWEHDLTDQLRRAPEITAALERMWPALSGAELVNDLFGFEALVRSAANGVLGRDEQRLLLRERVPVRDVAWTDADIALIDEADAILGPKSAARPRRRRRRRRDDALEMARRTVAELGVAGSVSAEQVLERYGSDGRDDLPEDDGELRTYGHVLVDEAQDLAPMQWRMLARRCPSASMTLVGDFGQASRPGALSHWDAVLANLPVRTPPRQVTLSVNYRTPAEIMELANRLLPAAAPGVEAARSVRRTGVAPNLVHVHEDDLVRTVASAARNASSSGGTVAVIAPAAAHDPIARALRDEGAIADSPEAIDAPIAVLSPLDAKGLEFDHVIVVEPARLVPADRAGLRLLYVVLTRATRALTVVHSQPLPEALTRA